MKDILLFFCTITFIGCAALDSMLFGMCVDSLLLKDRHWIPCLLASLGIMLVLTAIYTWIPGRIGAEITFLDELVTLRNDAFYQNLGIMLFMKALSTGLCLLKHIWASIRRKERFSGKFSFIALLFTVAFAAAGYHFVQDGRLIHLDIGDDTAYMVAFGLAIIGIIFFLWVVFSGRKDKNAKDTSTDAGQTRSTPAAGDADLARFEQIVAEKNRLTAAGDYASQIPLLTEGTGLKVDLPRKIRVWNYLGMAYDGIGSRERSEECYCTALDLDRHNPSSLNNMALATAKAGKYSAAIQYIELAVAEAKKRNQSLGMYYGNCAYVYGLSGDRAKARDFLQKAAAAGYDDASIRSIRSQIGLD